MVRPLFAVLAAAIVATLAGPAAAQDRGRDTGLPIPRFVSLRADEVNLRTGPGLRYPIEWVYQRRDMPVEVVDEFESWRQIRDWQGTLGWVHAVMLQAKRTARVVGDDPHILRARPNLNGDAVAMVEPGAIGDLESCRGNWCQVEIGGYLGWLRRAWFYGAYPGEALD